MICTTKQRHWIRSSHFLARGWNAWTTQASTSTSDFCRPSSETDAITKSHSLAGVDWEAGLNWSLSPAKRGKTTGKWDEVVPGATHSDSAPARILASIFRNPKASPDSTSYHPSIRVAWDRPLGQAQTLPDRYSFVCATELPPESCLSSRAP